MRRVIIESPYSGDVDRNVAYARACLLDSLQRGEAPIASHLLYTQVLDDEDPEERDQGMQAGWAWMEVGDVVVFYIDLGVSRGMWEGFFEALKAGVETELRTILED